MKVQLRRQPRRHNAPVHHPSCTLHLRGRSLFWQYPRQERRPKQAPPRVLQNNERETRPRHGIYCPMHYPRRWRRRKQPSRSPGEIDRVLVRCVQYRQGEEAGGGIGQLRVDCRRGVFERGAEVAGRGRVALRRIPHQHQQRLRIDYGKNSIVFGAWPVLIRLQEYGEMSFTGSCFMPLLMMHEMSSGHGCPWLMDQMSMVQWPFLNYRILFSLVRTV